MSIEIAYIIFLIVADVFLIGLLIAGVLEYRKKQLEFKNVVRKNRKKIIV